MAEVVYNRGKTRILNGDTPLDTADLRMLLITGTKTGASNPDLNTVADLDAVASVNIHTERVALTGEAVTQDDVNDRANADVANVTFAAAPGVTALAAVIYDEAGAVGTPPTGDNARFLISFHDTNFGAGQPLDGGLNVNVADWLRGQ